MYYPKSQIIPNLKTSGNQFQLPDGTPYNGDYFKTSDKRFYTGKSPSDKPNIEITPRNPKDPLIDSYDNPNPTNQTEYPFFEESEPYDENMYIIDDGYYNANPKLWDREEAPRLPQQSAPLPQEKDYKNGYFIRHFVKKTNEYYFVEVSQKEYNLFLNTSPKVEYSLYIPFTLKWRLKGTKEEVYKINQTLTSLKEKNRKLYGLSKYFKNNFNKYWVG